MKKRIQYLILPAFCLLNFYSFQPTIAQSWDWAKKMFSKASNAGNAIVTDNNGDSYVTGSFSDTLHIDDTYIVSKGLYDIFLAKFDSQGKLKWVKTAGGTDMDEAYGIALGKDGNIYITGYISGKADFSGQTVNGSTNRDFVLTKYDPNGKVIWVNLEAGVNEDYGTSVYVDKNNDVYATGVFHGIISTERTTLKSTGRLSTFIIKHDRDGNFLWSKTGVSTGSTEASEINVDNDGNVFVGGTFEGTARFDKKLIVSNHNKEVFLVKYSRDGEIQWLRKGGGATLENALNAIATDSTGNIFVTGYFSGTAFFGENKLKSNGAKDLFLVKYNRKGDVVWATHAGGKGDEIARSMEVDKTGNIFIVGEFNFSFTFGKSHINNIGDWDIFVLKYSKDSETMSGAQIGGIGYNKATGISLDKVSDVYLIGYFSKNASFGMMSLKTDRKEGSGFIAKYSGSLER